MSKTARPDSEPDPVDYVASIFRVRQRMLPPLRQIALADCGVPLERADILVELHGVRELGCTERNISYLGARARPAVGE